MAVKRRRFDGDFKAGAARIVQETGKPVAQVARDLEVTAGTLGNLGFTSAHDRHRRGLPRHAPVNALRERNNHDQAGRGTTRCNGYRRNCDQSATAVKVRAATA
jgi:transposase-like protein